MHACDSFGSVADLRLPWHQPDATTIAERVAAETARRIVQEEIPPGGLVTELELAARHQVSRTPAREAMLQLEAWGLVATMPKKGAIVVAETAAQRRNLLAVRVLFEIEAVETIAAVPGGLELLGARLDASLGTQRRAVLEGDLLAFATADYDFHAAIIEAANNEVIDDLTVSLAARFARLIHHVCLNRPEALPVLLAEHESLAAQAKAGDASGFAKSVRAHIRDTHFPEALA